MSLDVETMIVAHQGNDTATVFSFAPMTVLSTDDLVVTKVSSAGVETTIARGATATTYAMIPTVFPAVGSIRYPALTTADPLPAGQRLIIRRVLTIQQATDLTQRQAYVPGDIEDIYDRLVMFDLQSREIAERALRVPVSTSTLLEPVFNPSVPAPDLYAGKFLRVNSAGTGMDAVSVKSSGSLTIPLPVANGGTGSATLVGGRHNLAQSFKAHKSANATSIPLNAATKVTFDTEIFDYGSQYDPSTSRLTPGVAGKWRLTASVLLTDADITNGALRRVDIYKNGASVANTVIYARSDTWDGDGVQVTAIAEANGSGDYFEVYVTIGGGTSGVCAGALWGSGLVMSAFFGEMV